MALGAALLALVTFFMQGCIGADGKTSISHFGSPPKAAPAPTVQLVQTMWENRIVETEDVVNQGAPLPGIAGRVYLFGGKLGHPVQGKGTFHVMAHEVLPDGKSVPMEAWEIDPVAMQKLGSTDLIGWGYTVFLPFTNPRPDVKHVKMQVKFTPENGTPLFSPTTAVSLSDEPRPVITSNILPAGGFQKK